MLIINFEHFSSLNLIFHHLEWPHLTNDDPSRPKRVSTLLNLLFLQNFGFLKLKRTRTGFENEKLPKISRGLVVQSPRMVFDEIMRQFQLVLKPKNIKRSCLVLFLDTLKDLSSETAVEDIFCSLLAQTFGYREMNFQCHVL